MDSPPPELHGPGLPPIPAAQPPPLPLRRVLPSVFRLLGPLLVAVVLGVRMNGEIGHFLDQSWTVALLAVMCVLAYAGLTRVLSRVFSWLMLAGLLLAMVFFNVVFAFLAVDGPEADLAGAKAPLGWIAVVSLLAGLSAPAAASRALRPMFSAVSGNREWTSVRVLAVAAVVSLTLVSLVPLLILGAPPLLMAFEKPGMLDIIIERGRGAAGLYRDELYSLCWTLVAAALAVGYGVRRDWQETLERLGLLRISRRQVWIAVGLVAALVGAAHLLDESIAAVWRVCDWPTTDEATFEAIMAPFISPVGAVVVGICAGVGEEVGVRGILQPRLGILLSNLFFTALHSSQYHWDALLSVFLVGLVLGVIRKKTCTTVSAIVHGGYDFVLILWTALAGGS